MAEEMATDRVKAIQSSIQQQLQQRDQQLQQQEQQLQQRDGIIKRQQEENKRQQEENKRLAEQLQRLTRHIATSASAPPASATEHMQAKALSLLEVSSTGKQFTWKKTRDVTLRLRGKELSWWAFSKLGVQSCVIPSSVNIIFEPHKNKVEIRSYGTQQVFLRLFFNSSETAETWLRYLEDARQVSGTVGERVVVRALGMG